MSPSLLACLLQRLNLHPPVLSAGELRPHPDLAAMQQLGILRPASAATSYACADCGALRTVQMEACGTTTRGYISCTECGIVSQVELALLRRWAIDPSTLLTAIFQAAVAAPTLAALARPLWHIGKAGFQGRAKDLLFALGRHRDTDGAALNFVRQRPKSLLFVPTEPDVADWATAVSNTVIALQSVAGLKDGRFTFDRAVVEEALDGISAAAPPKKQTRRRASRMANIEVIKNELIQHIRDARNHARETRDRTGKARLLQCPTKEELARLAGVAPYDVTRCFRDEAGGELRMLWDLAHDLDRILYYGG